MLVVHALFSRLILAYAWFLGTMISDSVSYSMDKVTGSQVDCTNITLFILSNLEGGISALRLID